MKFWASFPKRDFLRKFGFCIFKVYFLASYFDSKRALTWFFTNQVNMV